MTKRIIGEPEAKIGRPAKPARPGKRAPLGLKVTAAVKELLDKTARANGRTQSQEAEARLEASFHSEALLPDVLQLAFGRRLAGLLIAGGELMQMVGRHSAAIEPGADEWADDPYSYDQAAKAMLEWLQSARPAGEIVPPDFKQTGASFGWPTDKIERAAQREREKPTSLVIEFIRTLRGRPATDWFADKAKQVRELLGPGRLRALTMPALTREIKEHDDEAKVRDRT
jgi:hypothetical protein